MLAVSFSLRLSLLHDIADADAADACHATLLRHMFSRRAAATARSADDMSLRLNAAPMSMLRAQRYIRHATVLLRAPAMRCASPSDATDACCFFATPLPIFTRRLLI